MTDRFAKNTSVLSKVNETVSIKSFVFVIFE